MSILFDGVLVSLGVSAQSVSFIGTRLLDYLELGQT